MAFLATPFGLGVLIIAILIGAIIFAKKKPKFPIIYKYPKDFFHRQAHHEYKTNTRKLLKEGAAKYGDEPFTILVPNGIKTTLPPSCVGWAKNNKDLDHQQLVRDEYFASYPGFEVQHVLHHPNRMVINMVQGKLSKTDKTLPVMNEHIKTGLSDIWGEDKSWKTINWEDGTTGVVSRAAASIFVGPELAADPEWQKVSRAYVLDYFGAVGEMHMCPPCRAGLKRAREMVNKVVQKRRQEEQEATLKGEEPPTYYDALAWTLESPLGNEFEPADVQLALAMAALFTTSELFRQILIEVARRPEVTEYLRREIEDAAPDHVFTATSLVRMQLLDSFMKETQRQIPSQVILERLVIRDTRLPDGTLLEKGTHVAIDSREMYDPVKFENPEEFDAWRFYKRRQAGDNTSLFVQSSPEHAQFGMGKHLCPGRFFAGSELKLCLAHIILKYDIRLKDGCLGKPMPFGFLSATDPYTQLEVRRR
ncbi:cytochrome P450 monooxygenase monooxygenase (lovA) [Fusarium pseudoanthophilum]|uniref:Cytochrome P450 monooxygenase monooxygenase (LovA) n=1 Tax=Fusarium pseudoanthophilum TaxID=48495 RepID=A0A8H5P5S8_9HYPO|nr:cytochrome P450 monooxygenase monooxygenase (lovA) [Fusarium pseudoanthophilum]